MFRDIAATAGWSVRSGHTLLANLVASGEVPLALTLYSNRIAQLKSAGAPVEWFVIVSVIGRANVACFFFSSRRRHTRCYRDWSSDVCLPISRCPGRDAARRGLRGRADPGQWTHCQRGRGRVRRGPTSAPGPIGPADAGARLQSRPSEGRRTARVECPRARGGDPHHSRDDQSPDRGSVGGLRANCRDTPGAHLRQAGPACSGTTGKLGQRARARARACASRLATEAVLVHKVIEARAVQPHAAIVSTNSEMEAVQVACATAERGTGPTASLERVLTHAAIGA